MEFIQLFARYRIVEILFPKQPLRARALEIISVHKIEVSEGVSIFIKGRKIKIPLPYRIKDGHMHSNFNFLERGHDLPYGLEILNDSGY